MNTQQIFGLQVLLSFVLYTLVARWYVSPRLAPLPADRALQPLLVLHATRHMGLVFLVPTVVGGVLPTAFAAAAGYGDLLAGLLALGSLVALRARARVAWPLAWVFNIVGLLDLVNAFYQGLSQGVLLGAAYYIPTFIVPALVVSHVMIFGILVRPPGTPASAHLPAPSHV